MPWPFFLACRYRAGFKCVPRLGNGLAQPRVLRLWRGKAIPLAGLQPHAASRTGHGGRRDGNGVPWDRPAVTEAGRRPRPDPSGLRPVGAAAILKVPVPA